MFERRTRERKHWAIIKRLGELSGTGVVGFDPDQGWPGLEEPYRTTAVAEMGAVALGIIIGTAGESEDQDVTKRLWKGMTPEAGAKAAVFVAHGLAATTEQLARKPGHHLNAEAHQRARELLRKSFPWSEEEEQAIAEFADDDDWDEARLALVFAALSSIFGEVAVRQLPGMAVLGGDELDRAAASLQWQICWNWALPPYLKLVDPDVSADGGPSATGQRGSCRAGRRHRRKRSPA
jgi:hypothetical protein